ncbi:unnamed protein product [Mesocestoides corti]|uniref:Uncharacterized protein n=2 Tax=Mesocestoides corti TaxID=53468 RepID=A0A0R3UHT6_MESCO|nr:unnamed protein product [Mesocestoides corti]
MEGAWHAGMSSQMSRHDEIIAEITRQIKKPKSTQKKSHHLWTLNRKPPIPSCCGQSASSPACLFDGKVRESSSGLTSSREDVKSQQSDGTWTTSSMSLATRDTSVAPTPIPPVKLTQCNTNYGKLQSTVASDPTDIDKCTELEAMKQGLARIQAGHGRPSDFLPEYQKQKVDPYLRKTLDEIRQSIVELSNDDALHQEVHQLRESVRELALDRRRPNSVSKPSKRESQVVGILKDIRDDFKSLRPGGSVHVPVGQDTAIMKELQEIRKTIHILQDAVDDVAVEPLVEPKGENAEIMDALHDIRQSLHQIIEGGEAVEQENVNKVEENPVMEALDEIRQSIHALTVEMQEEPEEPMDQVMQALTDIRQSVHILTGEDTQNDDSHASATNAMARELGELRKTVEKISEQLSPIPNAGRGENVSEVSEESTYKDSSATKKKSKMNKRNKSKSRKSRLPKDTGDDILELGRECCQDSCKLGCTCDRIIKYLIDQNNPSKELASGTPSIHYIVPPVTHPPTFIAPTYRPRTLSMPPMRYPQAPGGMTGLPFPHPQPLQLTYSGQSGPPPPPTSMPPYGPPPPPHPSYPPCQFPPPASFPAPQPGYAVPPSFSQPPGYPQPPVPPPPPPQLSRSVNYGQPPFQPTSNAPPANASNQMDQQDHVCNRTSSRQQQPQPQPPVFNATLNDQPMAFTLSFVGSTDAPEDLGSAPKYENRTFLCTQVNQ